MALEIIVFFKLKLNDKIYICFAEKLPNVAKKKYLISSISSTNYICVWWWAGRCHCEHIPRYILLFCIYTTDFNLKKNLKWTLSIQYFLYLKERLWLIEIEETKPWKVTLWLHWAISDAKFEKQFEVFRQNHSQLSGNTIPLPLALGWRRGWIKPHESGEQLARVLTLLMVLFRKPSPTHSQGTFPKRKPRQAGLCLCFLVLSPLLRCGEGDSKAPGKESQRQTSGPSLPAPQPTGNQWTWGEGIAKGMVRWRAHRGKMNWVACHPSAENNRTLSL